MDSCQFAFIRGREISELISTVEGTLRAHELCRQFVQYVLNIPKTRIKSQGGVTREIKDKIHKKGTKRGEISYERQ